MFFFLLKSFIHNSHLKVLNNVRKDPTITETPTIIPPPMNKHVGDSGKDKLCFNRKKQSQAQGGTATGRVRDY